MTLQLPSYIAGQPVHNPHPIQVFYPYDHSLTGTVSTITPAQLELAIQHATDTGNPPLSRHQRSEILRKSADFIVDDRDALAQLITRETGLCIRDTVLEVERSAEILRLAAYEALKDDGEVFSGDTTATGANRKVITFKQPLKLACAITPFNHPLNQVVHKVAPAIAAGTPLLVKPSEKAPLVAIRFAEILYRAGLPSWMLQIFLGDLESVVQPMLADPRVEMVTFTGSVAVGKKIAQSIGYKKLCLELGGNSPLIVLDDADLDLAARLAAEGAFRNSGQRCTSVKRILVQKSILAPFTQRLLEIAKTFTSGDPLDPNTIVGTVIDTAAASQLKSRIDQAVLDGAQLLYGGSQDGASLSPAVLSHVPRHTPMVAEESFGPLAPIIAIDDLDDAISYYNNGNFGLATAIVTNNLQLALKAAKHLRCGMTNINELPGYRIDAAPFGGIKDSGLGIKEGIIESIKFYQTTKTFSFPWD